MGVEGLYLLKGLSLEGVVALFPVHQGGLFPSQECPFPVHQGVPFPAAPFPGHQGVPFPAAPFPGHQGVPFPAAPFPVGLLVGQNHEAVVRGLVDLSQDAFQKTYVSELNNWNIMRHGNTYNTAARSSRRSSRRTSTRWWTTRWSPKWYTCTRRLFLEEFRKI